MTMMDAKVEVLCDGEGCKTSTFVDLHAGPRGTYLCSDDAIEREIEREGWICLNGSHYCDPDCLPEDRA